MADRNQSNGKNCLTIVSIMLAIISIIIAVVVLIFGNNIYKQINDKSVFDSSTPIVTPVVIVVTATSIPAINPSPTLQPTPILTSEPSPPQTSTPTPQPTYTPVPSVQTPIKFHIVSLQGVGTYTGENLELKAGRHTLGGVDFETGWIITTQSKGDVDKSKPAVYDIKVQEHILNPTKVHFLLQASWAKGQNGKELGSMYIRFFDGRAIEEKLIVGYNIRDWADVDTRLTAPHGQEAHRNSTKTGIVDLLTVNIPEEYQLVQITQIEIRDTSEEMGVHLWAVTIE